jgi:hypothetical protein
LVLYGRCPYYVKAQELGRLFVPFDETGHSLEDRVGRHLVTIAEFVFVLGLEYPRYEVIFDGIPDYEDVLKLGIGAFLL